MMKITENEIRLVDKLNQFREEYELKTDFILKGFSAAVDLFKKSEIESTTADKVLDIINGIHSILKYTVINVLPRSKPLDNGILIFKWKNRNKEYSFSNKENNFKYFLYSLCSYKEAFVLSNNLLENISVEYTNFKVIFYQMVYSLESIIEEYVQSSDPPTDN